MNVNNKQIKCYLYLRVSTTIQVDGYSLEAQEKRLVREAEYSDMKIVGTFVDAGKSGKNIAGRPEFQNMLSAIQENRDDVKYVLVFKLSRFGRTAADVLSSLLKREWINRFKIRDYNHAYKIVFEYIEAFYNTVRIHSHCGYQSPNAYEKISDRNIELKDKKAS